MTGTQTPAPLRLRDNPDPDAGANVEAVRAALQRFLDAAYSTSPRVREIVDQVVADCRGAASQNTNSQNTKLEAA